MPKAKKVCAIAIDTRNVFNSIRWMDILSALEEKKIPLYLRKMVDDYLRIELSHMKAKDAK